MFPPHPLGAKSAQPSPARRLASAADLKSHRPLAYTENGVPCETYWQSCWLEASANASIR